MKEVIEVKDIRYLPEGNRFDGFVSLNGGEFKLPVSVLRGKKEGKTVLITAGIHAAEYVGIQAAIELSDRLDPQKISGTVILVKVVNRSAFECRNGSFCVEDGKNLNRVFPGSPNGTEADRLAFGISSQLQAVADYYIDLHSGDAYEKLTPYVYYPGKAEKSVVELSKKMAMQTDVPYMVRSDVSGGGAYNYAAASGIPSILIERGDMGDWNMEEVFSDVRDVWNILVSLGIYEGVKDERNYHPIEIGRVCYLSAADTGLWYPEKKPGDIVKTGDILGCVKDYQGRILEVFEAEFNGVVLYETASLQVVADGPAITYGEWSEML